MDATGNFTTGVQTIAVQDVTAPSISVPASVTVSCQDATTPAANGSATGTDNCSAVAISYTDNSTQDVDPLNSGHYNYTITRTWKSMDVTGNFTTGTQTITVQDITKPVITCPASLTVACNASTAIGATGMATATDNCSPVTITYTDNSTQDANANNAAHYNYTITRTWKAADVTGNFITCAQIITVEDAVAPTIVSCPASVTVNCQDATTTTALGVATGTDNCSPVAVTYSDVSTQDVNANSAAHYNYTITRTWTLEDVTGNSNSCTQVITVQDVTAPVITVPANVTVNCQDATTPEANGSATGSDNCSSVAISYTDVSTLNTNASSVAHYNYTITRTWKAVDATGNYTTGIQTITVQDVTAPSITVPASVIVNCQDDKTPAANGSATGTDNCSAVAISYTDNSTQDANPANSGHYNYTITRMWKSMDVTGNYTTGAQTITVQDVTAPSITVPTNVTVNCQDDKSPAANGSATGTDNCSSVAISYTDNSNQDGNPANIGHYNYTITRTWKSMDVTGNYTTGTQTITVQDVTAPSITVPTDKTVNCQDDKSPAANGSATGTDNCSAVAISYTDVSTQDANTNSAAHYNYTITRTWKAMDVTGNYTVSSQVITVQDVTAPSIVVPMNKTVSCQDDKTPAANGSATGADNCSPVAISYTDVSTQSANVNNAAHYNYTITRTWKSMDVTGNYTTGIQLITVQDITAPAITCPANTTVSCKTTTATNGTATGTDNCAPVAITYSDVSMQNNNPATAGYYNYTITRTWKATDVSGNYTTCNQVITVNALNNAAIVVNPVNTINANHPNHTIYIGYGPQSVTLTASTLGGVGTKTYSWSPTTGVANPTSASTSVSPTTTTTYTVTITDGTGCTITKSVTINVVDVRCGNKIKICHYPPGNPGNPQQLCLPASAIPAHLAHGCKLGDCPSSKNGESGDDGDHEFETHGLVVNEVKVYPNPNTGVFYVELPAGMESANIAVTDMAGKLILTKAADGNKIQIDLGSVAQGMYMVHVTSGDQSYRSRVVVE